ncbi:MAG: flagellar assembly protein FliX [Acetobacteraceae bacterium]
MTTIDRLGGTGRTASVRPGRSMPGGAAGFVLPEARAAPDGADSIGETVPTTLLGAMLALQEAAADRSRDRAARRHGEAVLTALMALQVRLLDAPAHRGAALAHLAKLVAQLPQAADPALGALIRDLTLRAEVELARGTGSEECP